MNRSADDLRYDVVVPTIGRPSLSAMLESLAAAAGPLPGAVVVVDDRADVSDPLFLSVPAQLAERVRIVRGPARGPAAARNAGWRETSAPWVSFLDDDVVPGPRWRSDLVADLGACAPDTAGSQGRIVVPLPGDRKPTDCERNVAGLESACWATADMAYRRRMLEQVGGFEERFRRAYREDVDLALRMIDAGWTLTVGERRITHPVRPAGPWVSIRLQAGNADDALMSALHGADWRERGGVPRGRRRAHVATSAAAVAAVAAAAAGRRRLAAAGGAGWLIGTARFATERVRPGPRTAREVATMIATSAAIPPVATYHWVAGLIRARGVARHGATGARPAAVLFDRDGTLVHDVPYNGDPGKVRPVPGAREALDRLRAAGIPVGVVSNQSGIDRGLISVDQVDAVNRRVEELLGPFDVWLVCPHGPEAGCECRKPEPGMIIAAAAHLGVEPAACAFVGDIGADVDAAMVAGARPILVPTRVTRPEEVARAPEVVASLPAAVDLLLGGRAVSSNTDVDIRRSA